MFSPLLTTAIDYNRGLLAPIRWAHVACAACRAWWDWACRPERAPWVVPTALIVGSWLFVLPFDPAISAALSKIKLAGDFRRELETLQQFGQGGLSVVIGLAIFALDRARRKRLLDWILAAVVLQGLTFVIKGFVGRPRPGLENPYWHTGPIGAYPLAHTDGATGEVTYVLTSSWGSGYDLASMPSRHAAFATLGAMFIAGLYPRLRPLVVVLAFIVYVARVALGAHYPSDVLVGAAVGWWMACVIVDRGLGVRLADWVGAKLSGRGTKAGIARLG